MTISSDRIDRIEALLEQFISASVADRQSSDDRMTRLEQSMEQQRQESNERMTRIEENQEATDAKVGVLVTCVDTLAVDVRELVEYLRNQSGNGRRGS